jgi:hypothetical protein
MNSPYFIITDYNHLPQDLSTSWIPKYAGDNYLIYDRADRWKESDKIRKQINVGENIYDMMDFIVENYENLPEVMVFVKADVIPRHCSEEKFTEVIRKKEYTPIENYSRNTSSYFPGAYSFVDENDGYSQKSVEIDYITTHIHFCLHIGSYYELLTETFENPEFGEYIRFAPGGCHLVPRETILKYTKSFYEWLREASSWYVQPGEAYIIERALNTIFGSNYKIKDKYRNL